VQTEESRLLLKDIKINNVTLAGDTRFDRVLQIASGTRNIRVAQVFKGDSPCVVAGSTWPPDENFLLEFIHAYNGQAKFIIAPHEVHDDHIRKIIRQLKKPHIRFSSAHEDNIADKQVLIIDNIGMLSSLYRYGDIAYIGGGFGNGIHNILEAATFGLPIIFGPNYSKFNEAVELIRLGGALSFNTMEELNINLKQWLDFREARLKAGSISKNFVHKKAGATETIINRIFSEQK